MIDRISVPDSSIITNTGESFDIELTKISQPSLTSLHNDLLADPEIKNFIQKNEGNRIYLENRADGGSQLLSSSGEFLIIEKDSPINQKLRQFFDRCMQNQLHLSPHRPNAVLLTSQPV